MAELLTPAFWLAGCANGCVAGAHVVACETLGTVAQLPSSAAERVGKGASRCLRSALGLPTSASSEGVSTQQQQEQHTSVLAYSEHALAAILATVALAFHAKSYWTATALLDVPALWAVWRSHRTQHAEAAAAAAVRRAAADPANTATHTVAEPAREVDMRLLRCAAAHATAAYGQHAASGSVSSALGYLSLITIQQATAKAPRRIPAAQHLAAVQQLTGVPPADVLAAQWVAHLHRPAFYVALDRAARRVVVCVRGTLQLGDFCTILNAVPQPFGLCGTEGHVHAGFLAAARNLLPPVTAALRTAASQAPGWPTLITGHSLGGGVAAVLTMLLADHRQRAHCEAEAAGQPWPPCPQQQQQHEQPIDPLWRLGEVSCVGIGAAAAFDQALGMAARPHVTSVLFGMDCLPLFSVLGARLLIEEVHAKSRAAALVAGLLRRAGFSSSGSSRGSSAAATPTAAAAAAAAAATAAAGSSRGHSRASSLGGGDDARSMFGAMHSRSPSTASSDPGEGSEIEEAACSGGGAAGSRLRRCGSAWSSASTASLQAFTAEDLLLPGGGDATGSGGAAALVPMFPPGRLLWLLPNEAKPEGAPPQLVETDQTAFKRFLVTLETTSHHLPDTYARALSQLGG